MNDTKIVDAVHGRIAAVDVTSLPEFTKLLSLVNSTRASLLFNSALRAPYVDLLRSLYKKRSRHVKKITELRPDKPTDEDIRQYFEGCWPEVTLATPLNNDTNSFVWGFTYVGVVAADDNVVYINGSLIKHWLTMDTKSLGFSVQKISLLITSTIYHELVHRLIVWWSKGCCHTPNISPVSNEWGNFLEKRMFGGPVMGWWTVESVGDFEKLQEIGIITRLGPRFFDENTVSNCLNRLLQPDAQLPIITPLSLPQSDATHLVRAKLVTCHTPPRKVRQYTPYQKGVMAEGTGLGLGLGLTCTQLFKNDKIPYPCT